MNRGVALVQAAKLAQAELAGIRVKVRVPSPLWCDVKRCAEACGWSAEAWVCAVCRMYASGRLGVPMASFLRKGTREESEPVWVRVPEGFDRSADSLRAALAAGVEWYTPLMPEEPVNTMIEGRDYFVEGRNYSSSAGFFRKVKK